MIPYQLHEHPPATLLHYTQSVITAWNKITAITLFCYLSLISVMLVFTVWLPAKCSHCASFTSTNFTSTNQLISWCHVLNMAIQVALLFICSNMLNMLVSYTCMFILDDPWEGQHHPKSFKHISNPLPFALSTVDWVHNIHSIGLFVSVRLQG